MKKRCLFLLFFFVSILPLFNLSYAQEESRKLPRLLFFYSPSCNECLEVKDKFMPEAEAKLGDVLEVEYRDISIDENLRLLLGLEEKYKNKEGNKLPVLYFQGRFLRGKSNILKSFNSLISAGLRSAHQDKSLPFADLLEHFRSFSSAAVVSAGLIDGINPCAFTVIVFFISFLALQGYRRRELVIIGLSFILAVFASYLLIGLGIFNFLYRLQGAWILAKVVNITIALLSITLGVLALLDYFKFKRTHQAEGLVLQLPQAIKKRIQQVIGLHYRKGRQEDLSVEPKKRILSLVLTALTTGFLISLLEAVCTGQVYLPTISFVLKTSEFKLQALGYLLLYNLMFIIPLLLIFLFALLGVTSGEFSRIFKKHLAIIKLLMAALFFALGLFLLWREVPVGAVSLEGSAELKTLALDNKKIADQYSRDFGEVKEGEVLEHGFVFTNTTQKALTVRKINTSCGCTTSGIEKKELAPGESTLLEVKFDTKGYSGPTRQSVLVYTDDPENPVVRFRVKADIN